VNTIIDSVQQEALERGNSREYQGQRVELIPSDAYPAPEKWLRPTASSSISLEDEIRLRAYSLYVQQGRRNGFALDDWLRAEAEILGIDRQ
jgi:hypothetical protein